MKARIVEGYVPEFDLDLRYGKDGERLVSNFLTGLLDGTVEVKTDGRATDTGNVYIEYECRRSDGWHDSGIRSSKASYWALVIAETIVIGIPTPTLRWCVERAMEIPLLRVEEKDGTHPTKGVRIGLSVLMTWVRIYEKQRRKAAAA